MLKQLIKIFESGKIEINDYGETLPLHSHTSMGQGIFLQNIFDMVKPVRSIEVGFA